MSSDPRGGRPQQWRPTAKRRFQDLVRRGLALPWEGAFAALGALDRRRPERWRPADGHPVLVVSPHPDDEVHGCGGTILLHRAAGDPVTVLHVTDGRASRALGLGPDEMARRRRGEAEAAAEVLGLTDMEWLGFPEGAWGESDVAAALGSAVDRLRPSLIYAPSTVDFHPEHRGVALALARALGQCDAGALPPRLRVYPVQVPLTRILVNRLAATGDVAATSRAALETYATQVGALRSSLRMKRYAALRYRAGTQAEVFWELPADDYRDMVLASADPVCPPSRPLYRGVRRLPFSDPLAYLRGRRARRRLGAIAARE